MSILPEVLMGRLPSAPYWRGATAQPPFLSVISPPIKKKKTLNLFPPLPAWTTLKYRCFHHVVCAAHILWREKKGLFKITTEAEGAERSRS